METVLVYIQIALFSFAKLKGRLLR